MHVDRTSRRLVDGVEDAADSGAVQPDGVCAIGIFTGPQEQIDAGDFGPVPGEAALPDRDVPRCLLLRGRFGREDPRWKKS